MMYGLVLTKMVFSGISRTTFSRPLFRHLLGKLLRTGSLKQVSTWTVPDWLNSLGLEKQDIYSCPELINMPPEELREKCRYLEGKVNAADDVVSLLTLPIKDIIKYLQVKDNCHKISQLSSILKCSESEASQLFVKYRFLLRSKMSTVKEKITIMLEGGVKVEDLKRDLWILTYTKHHIQERLEIAKQLQIQPVRPWMLRCKQQFLSRAMSNKEENLMAMAPHHNSMEYLCDRLNLDESCYKSFISKYPPVARVQVSKLKELIDFLLYEGFTALQIFHTPRILCHSVHTIKDRLTTLREINCSPHNLAVLCKNRKQFERFVIKRKASYDQLKNH